MGEDIKETRLAVTHSLNLGDGYMGDFVYFYGFKTLKAYECCLGPLREHTGQGLQIIICGTLRFQRDVSGTEARDGVGGGSDEEETG